MTSTTEAPAGGSAARWGPLWGARPEDWALSEEQQIPTYEEALQRVGLEPGQLVLDVGCGVGVFLRLVAERGAKPFGLDASQALIDVARERVPDAELRVGDMESLPYEGDTFDLVTGFNSFFFANDMVAALREAGRVAKPGAPVVIQVWGPHDRNDLEAMKEIARPFLPPRPADAPPSPTTRARRAGGDGHRGGARARSTSTPLGRTSSPTRTRSAARSSPPPGSPCSSGLTARSNSRTPSSRASRATAPLTAATGSTTRTTT